MSFHAAPPAAREEPQTIVEPLLAFYREGSSAFAGATADRKTGFDEGIERTVQWYRDNEDWWGPIRSGEYRAYYEQHTP